MVLAIVILAIAANAAIVMASVALARYSERGWQRALDAHRVIRELQTARITTLENRLLANSWGEFANLQAVPDETAKMAWAEQQFQNGMRRPESFGVREEERQAEQFRHEGADLEGEVFEGPTIG